MRNADAARGRQRPRRGAERSVPALVLELERPLDGDRRWITRRGSRRRISICGPWSAGCSRRARTAAGATRRRTRWRWRRSSLLPRTKRRSPTSRPSVELRRRQAAGAAGVQGPLGDGDDEDVPMQTLLASGPAGASRDLTFAQDRHRHALLHGAAAATRSTRRGSTASTAASPSRARTSRPRPARRARPGRRRRPTRPATWSASRCAFDLTKERRYVAVVDPLPAGFEPVESWFATTARDLAGAERRPERAVGLVAAAGRRAASTTSRSYDDRVRLFATRLGEGQHEFSYVVRATTAGTPRRRRRTREEMYEPEVFGRTATAAIDVKQVKTLIARAAGAGAGWRALARRRTVRGRRRSSSPASSRGLDPARPAAGRPARRGRRGALDDRPRPQRRGALRGALRISARARCGCARIGCRRRWSRRRWPPRIIASTRTGASIRSRWRARRGATSRALDRVEGGSTLTQQVAKLLLDRRAQLAAGTRGGAAGRRRSRRRSSRCASSIGCRSARSSRST